MGFNGGQLLLLALGACFANDVPARRTAGLEVLGVRAVVECDWSGDPPRANVRYSMRVEAEASRTRSSS